MSQLNQVPLYSAPPAQSHGARHGKGKYTWSNGASYDGSYDAGRRHGSGTMSFPDKSSYTGEFADNSPHGKVRRVAEVMQLQQLRQYSCAECTLRSRAQPTDKAL